MDEHQGTSDSLALERLVFFSDAVIAIAITLLVIGLELPNVSGADDRTFINQLAALAPHYVAFVYSFFVIALYWMAHHRMFRFIVRWSTGLLAMNLVFLFFVVQLPLLSSLIGSYGYLSTATAIYAGGLCLMGFASVALWVYALRRGLVSPDLDRAFARFLTYRGLAAPAVFAVSIPLAFISPQLAQVTWVAVTIVTAVIRREFSSQPER